MLFVQNSWRTYRRKFATPWSVPIWNWPLPAIAQRALKALPRSSRCRKNTEENIIMQTLRDNYFNAYRSLKLTRDAEGVLVAQFHTDGGPFTFTAQDHTEFADAFYRIAQDRANKI